MKEILCPKIFPPALTFDFFSHPALSFHTVLDQIIEFAKVLYVSHFVSGHRFNSPPPVVRLPQMQSVFLVCLSGRVHEVDMSRHGQNSHEVLQQILCCAAHKHLPQWRHVS